MKTCLRRALPLASLSALCLLAAPASAQRQSAESKKARGDELSMSAMTQDQAESITSSLKDASGALRQAKRDLSDRPMSVAQVLSQVGKKSPAKLLEWVRAHIAFEPYEGALRSPEVVLSSGSANAVDAARLLKALLEEGGHEAAYAWGRLSEEDATVMLLKFVELVQYRDAPGAEIKESEIKGIAAWRRLVRDHVWVEASLKGGETIALDPFASLDALSTPAQRAGGGQALPSGLDASFAMSLIVRFEDDREETFVPIRGALEEFAERTVTLSFERDAKLAHTTRPVLTHGEEVRTGDYFPHEQVERVALRFELTTGPYEQLWTQSLYERGRSPDVFGAEQLHVGVTLLPAWISSEAVARRGVEGFEAASLSFERLVKAQREAALKPSTPLSVESYHQELRALTHQLTASTPYLLARHLDRLIARLSGLMAVSPVLARPRLIITALARDGEQLFIDADIQGDSLVGIAASGLPAGAAQGFITLYSRLESEARAQLLDALTSKSALTPALLLARSEKKGVAIVTVSPDDTSKGKQIKVDRELKNRLARRVKRAGRVLLAPLEEVEVDEQARYGWWEIHAVDGWIEGRMAHGLLNQPLRSEPLSAVSQGAGFVALSGLMLKQMSVFLDALDTSQSDDAMICRVERDLSALASKLCAHHEGLEALTLKACLAGEQQGTSSAALSGGAAMGDPLGGSLKASDCAALTRPARCGALIASASLLGQLQVLRGNALGEFIASPEGALCSR